MRRITYFMAALAALAIAQSASAQDSAARIAPRANGHATLQAMNAEVVVVGKVVEIEKEMVKATAFPNAADKVDYHIAVIKINESLLGANGLTAIRVGFQPVGNNVAPPGPNVRPNLRPAISRVPHVVLTEGQEGCFFLTKHHNGDFHVMQASGQPLDKSAADFDKQLGTVKKLLKVIEDPKAALKAKEASDRQFAACMLVQRYRQYPRTNAPNAQVVQEAIDAEESKLILTVLGEMEWAKVDGDGISLQNVFYQLGLQPKDGWAQPKVQNGQDFNKIMGEAVAKWMKENADKYRVQRQVVSK
jgi:hypothetical protein